LESELNKALGEIVRGGARVVDIKISTAGTLNAYMAIAIVIYDTSPNSSRIQPLPPTMI